MSVTAALQEDRRGLILSALDEAGGMRLAESSLKRILDNFAHRISTDQLRGDLDWLRAQGLVQVDKEGTWIVQLLDPGLDVARGVPHPGVARQPRKR